MTSTPAGSYGRHSLSTAFLQAYVDQEIAEVIDLAPATLDSLNELAAAINDDPAFFTTMATANTTLQTNIDTLTTNASNARTSLQTLLQNAVDAVQADVNTNEADADTAFAAEASARASALTTLQTTLEAALAVVQADVDQNESDADAAIAVVQADVDQNEADADSAIAVVQADVDANEVSRKAVIDIESNITSVKNAVRGTSIAVGNNITFNPAAGGRVEIEGDLLLDNQTDVIDGAGVTLTSFTNINAYDGRLNTLEADPTTKTYVDTQVAGLVDSAPGVLNTLDELAAALGDDANFATTITNSIAAVQTDVDANEVTAAGLVTAQNTTMLAAVAVVQADVNQNETDADAAIAAVQADVNPNETAAAALVTAENTAMLAAVAVVQADVNQNETDADAAIATEKARIDAILSSADADKDTFAEIVTLINSVDTTNDNAFASYVTSNNSAVAAVQADVDANETASDAAEAALSTRLDTLEADPTTATAVAAVQADVDSIEAAASTARTNLQTALQNAIDAVQADVNTNESDADTAIGLKAALTGAIFTGDITLKKSDGSAVALRLSRTDNPDMNTEWKVQPSYVSIDKECLSIMAGSDVVASFDERQRVAINTTDPDYTLDVGGDGNFSTNLTVGAAVNLTLTNAANDSAADSAGVAVGQLYRNGSVVMIRVS